MTTLIHADIFFFITTIVVVVLGIAFLVILIYAALSIRALFRISRVVEEETKKIVNDVEEMRTRIKRHPLTAKTAWTATKRFFSRILHSGSSGSSTPKS